MINSINIDCNSSSKASNSVIVHYAAFNLGLYCFPKYLFRGFWYTKGSVPTTDTVGTLYTQLQKKPISHFLGQLW